MDDGRHLNDDQRYAMRAALAGDQPLPVVRARSVADGDLTRAQAREVADELDPGAGARWRR